MVYFCRSKKGEYVLEHFFVKPYQAREEKMLHLANLDLFHLVNHVTLRAQLYLDSFLTSLTFVALHSFHLRPNQIRLYSWTSYLNRDLKVVKILGMHD